MAFAPATFSAIETEKALKSAVNWLLHSGIQNSSDDPRTRGGVHAWYDSQKSSFAFLYPEITGYAITTLLFLYDTEGDPLFLEHAKLAGDWIISEAIDRESGAVRCRYDGEAWMERLCAFDNGMCINGLTNLFRITNDERYVNAAIGMADWLITVMQRPDGSFYSKHFTTMSHPQNPGGKWSLISGSYLVKLAIGLLNLAEVTSEKRYSEAARLACTWALTRQQSDGRFITNEDDRYTFVHPHCYSAEGLLVAGLILGEKVWIDAARKAVDWIAPHQLRGGGFPAWYEKGEFLLVESPDITAQILRLWYLLPEEYLSSVKIDIHGALKSIVSYQSINATQEQHGGYTSGDAWFYGEEKSLAGRHLNSWVTMFCVQSLALARAPMEGMSLFYLV